MVSKNATYKKRCPRLYVDQSLALNKTVFFGVDQCHYLLTVLRKASEEEVLLFNGADGEWLALLKQESKKQLSAVCVQETRAQDKIEDVWVGFSPLKKHRQDFLIEKTTELGASFLIPLEMTHTNLFSFNQEKVQRQCIEAAEQSERLSIPQVANLVKLKVWLEQWPAERLLYVALERADGEERLGNVLDLHHKVAFLVGPEGGFSELEVRMLSGYPFVRFFSLGSTILRAETAAILCMGMYQQLKKD